MKIVKLAFSLMLILSLENRAHAGCLRCDDGHVICHGTCDDPIKGSARDILGKQFCAPETRLQRPCRDGDLIKAVAPIL